MADLHNRGSPRLQFTNEERASRALEKPIARAEKAADKAEAARKKLRNKHRLKLSVEEVTAGRNVPAAESSAGEAATGMPAVSDEGIPDVRTDPDAPGVKSTRQRRPFGKPGSLAISGSTAGTDGIAAKADGIGNIISEIAETAMPGSATKHEVKKKVVRLKFEETKAKKPSRMTHTVEKTVRTAGDQFHRQAAKANQDDPNVAVDAALQGDGAANTALQAGEHAYHARKLRPYKQAAKAEKKLDKANISFLEAKRQAENPQFSSNPISRWQQKHAIRKEYAAARHSGGKWSVKQATTKVGEAAEKAKDVAAQTVNTVRKHPVAIIFLGLGALILFMFAGLQGCAPVVGSIGGGTAVGSYPAEEADVRAAERAYLAKERELKDEMDHYERYHPGYDEYHVDQDEIWHDPYVLMAIISAYKNGEEWNASTAAPVMEKYFKLQYVVTETVTTETRYRKETRTGTRVVTDPETGASHTETYTYEVDVPYTYTICNVTLENKDLSHLPVVSMSHEQMSMYAMYMSTHGNMEGVFSGPHAPPLKDPTLYEIPQSLLDADPEFARLMEEATKYIGYPYVWGGSDPDTSFDCSGFVSYVFTNSGVYNTGRLGAKGLRSLCRNVPNNQARPGDIVFFEGTMGEDVEGITHCGIYVGNGMMIHCGNPIGFANLNDSYWRKHFHSYGRVPN